MRFLAFRVVSCLEMPRKGHNKGHGRRAKRRRTTVPAGAKKQAKGVEHLHVKQENHLYIFMISGHDFAISELKTHHRALSVGFLSHDHCKRCIIQSDHISCPQNDFSRCVYPPGMSIYSLELSIQSLKISSCNGLLSLAQYKYSCS